MALTERSVIATRGLSWRHRWPLYLAWLVYGTLLLVAVLGWAIYVSGQRSVLAYAFRYDFLNVYIGAQAVLSGQGAHLYDLELQRTLTDQAITPYSRPLLLPYTYPGYVAVFLAPLGLLPYAAAFVVWGLLNLAIVVWAIRRLVPATTVLPGERVALILLAGSFTPVLLGLLQGQFQLPVLLGLVQAVLALRSGHERRAGAWLLLGLIKPHLILLPLLALLLARRFRALAVFAAGTLLITLVSLLVLGNWLPSYLALLLDFTRQGQSLSNYPEAMQNWRGLLAALFGSSADGLATGLLLVLDSVSVLLLIRVYGRGRGVDPSGRLGEVGFALAILLGLLVSPHLYLHDVAPALLAGCLLWRATNQAREAGLVEPREPHARTAIPRRGPVLRWALGSGGLVLFAAQFWSAGTWGIQPGAWYLIVLVGLVLWTWPELLGQAPA